MGVSELVRGRSKLEDVNKVTFQHVTKNIIRFPLYVIKMTRWRAKNVILVTALGKNSNRSEVSLNPRGTF